MRNGVDLDKRVGGILALICCGCRRTSGSLIGFLLSVSLVRLCSLSCHDFKLIYDLLYAAFVSKFDGIWLILEERIAKWRNLPLCKHLESADCLELAVLLLF